MLDGQLRAPPLFRLKSALLIAVEGRQVLVDMGYASYAEDNAEKLVDRLHMAGWVDRPFARPVEQRPATTAARPIKILPMQPREFSRPVQNSLDVHLLCWSELKPSPKPHWYSARA
jgi:hypothetical protein